MYSDWHSGLKWLQSKNPVESNANGEDTSFIVFAKDGKPDKKDRSSKASSNVTPANSASLKNPDTKANEAAQDGAKKPDIRTLIAGPSWTGKLPMTLFNELCQKQRWEKPEYTVHRNASGFTGAVVLRQKNPKTQEISTLPPIIPPLEYMRDRGPRESAAEAKHFAATYALFRVGNMKNIHMGLPPQYRDLWKGDFQNLKTEAIAQGNGYLYEADPFLAKRHHDEGLRAKEKAKADRAKKEAEDKKSEIVSLDGQVQSKHVLKGWSRAPKVEMGAATRRQVERLIRDGGAWNLNQAILAGSERNAIVSDLSNIGFRRSHVQEATEICKDREECLEWLLIHVPEDDLPKWALPENYMAGISLASGDMKREGQLKRLSASGYSLDLCEDALDACNADETAAAALLQHNLLGEGDETIRTETTQEIWDEEQTTLASIYGDRMVLSQGSCLISLELPTPMKQPLLLRTRPPPAGYPRAIPILSIEGDLPSHVRLSIAKQALVAAKKEFLGEQMLFNIIDWLEQNTPAIIDNPGRLQEVAGAVSAPENNSKPRERFKSRKLPRPVHWSAGSPQSQELLDAWKKKQSSTTQQNMLTIRQTLPAWKLRDEIISSVSGNQVTIISGETGSGKSTQSVQFILDDLIQRGFGEQANIICTQPRRISALGLADRVSEERCGKVGDEVGYAIRGESKQRHGVTKITFVTAGVLLRRLQTSGDTAEDVTRSLADVTHVVIDEVHERSLDTDFLMVLLRDILKTRKDLKLVLMSATLDAQTFENYFARTSTVGKVEIEGRTHPVQDIYLDEILRATGFGALTHDESDSGFDSTAERSRSSTPKPENLDIGSVLRAVGTRINHELISQTVGYINRQLGNTDGGILIFLPGVAEIDQTIRALRKLHGLHVLPLHASLQSSEQKRVFAFPPRGTRKVVVATNVAETSITIEDIVAVIDTGRVKETTFDPANSMVKLVEVWASRAACKQRRGRAGRVRAGQCYKLYTRAAEAKMAERPDPEIRRVPLEQLCLSVKAIGIKDVPAFLASALTPPDDLAVEGALKLLGRMGALHESGLTALGRHLSMIPADLRCSKLIVYGATFGCLESSLTIAAILSVKSPFVSPPNKRPEAKEARAAFSNGYGDLLCDLRAYEQWSAKRAAGEPSSSVRFWCDSNFLNQQTLFDISTNRIQLRSSLQETGFLSPDDRGQASRNGGQSSHSALLQALIAGSFQPQVVRIDFPDTKYAASSSGAIALDPEARMIKYFDEDNQRAFVHPSSTLFDAQTFPGNSVFMSYFTKMATSKVFIRDLTPFNVYSLLMFSGPIVIDPQGRGLLVDKWVRLRGWARIGVLVSRLRMMLDELLGKKLDDPSLEISQSEVVHTVKKLIELDGLDR